jgi:hypothetical protein
MRTTLTIDDDVAAALERLRKKSDVGFKDLVNDVLRRGLNDLRKPQKRGEPFRTRSVTLGHARLANIDNIGEALAIAEGEPFK